ncbi:MAG: MarR family transcriptional regulator [Gammaproteobacteria bacterium]|nr:MarR family transcriptional regulator [Gammaproteobacteria bacterium]
MPKSLAPPARGGTRPRAATLALTSVKAPRTVAHYRGDTYTVDASYGYLVRQLQASLLRQIDKRIQPYDLTALQWSPLLLLAQNKGDTAAALARSLEIDTGAMTRMLDRLEMKKLIRRTRSTGDRRVVHLELTAEGRRVVEQVPFVLAEVLNLHLAGFSKGETEQLIGFLRRMVVNGNRTGTNDD